MLSLHASRNEKVRDTDDGLEFTASVYIMYEKLKGSGV